MSIVLGLTLKNETYIGADSASIAGNHHNARNDGKIFKLSKYLTVACTGSYRKMQILQHHTRLPERDWISAYRYALELAENFRHALKEHGCEEKFEHGAECGMDFLMGMNGQFVAIECDFSVIQTSPVLKTASTCYAQGSGATVAEGAAAALLKHTKFPAKKIVQEAFKVAEHFVVEVKSPFSIWKIK